MRFFTLIFVCVFVSASQITLDFLQNKPKGIARDFYIWRYLQDPKTSLEDAIKAYDLVYKKTPKLEDLLAKKGYTHELPKEVACKKLSFEKLKQEDGECIAFGLKLSIIPSISPTDAEVLVKKLAPIKPILAQEVQILESKNPLSEMIKSKNAQIFSEIFYGLNLEQRLDIFNRKIPPKDFALLANQNDANFNKMMQYVLLSEHFEVFKKTILNAPIINVDDKMLLLLGIIHAKYDQITQAQNYFSLILQNPKDPLIKDKALFWQYLISKDEKYLQTLSQSQNLNLYSIFANQKLKTTPQYTITSKLENIKDERANFDITDPFEWQILRNKLTQIPTGDELKPILDQKLTFSNTQPHLAFMLNRIKKYKSNYFLMPYSENLTWKNQHQKALTYAIAKQESNLLPALVSSSYALGMMQIMPFNLKPFAKALGKENVTLDDLFNPSTALEFGRFYLAELEREFSHPLFVAYAYNGGPGFWRRTLKRKTLFIKDREYDPWLSLELIPYEESKNYGQIVLANYIIYQQILGQEINVEDFLSKTLVN